MLPEIIGMEKLHAKILLKQREQLVNSCMQQFDLQKVCWSWKVPVTQEECTACHTGDTKARLLIIERSVSGGADRRRSPRACENFGDVVSTVQQPCCGGGKTQIVSKFICKAMNIELFDTKCYTCPLFKEKANAGA